MKNKKTQLMAVLMGATLVLGGCGDSSSMTDSENLSMREEEDLKGEKVEENKLCDHQGDWDKCNGRVVEISGKRPEFIGQHPLVVPFGSKSSEDQSYLEIENGRQIILLSDELIDCPAGMTVTGRLSSEVGPCDEDAQGKSTYCGLSIKVSSWQCL